MDAAAELPRERPLRRTRPRRSNLAVPGSSPKMLGKAQTLAADQVFLDLEDAVAPSEKVPARRNVVAALREGAWGDIVCTVRINDTTTPHAYRDLIEVVEGAGEHLDCVMLPKVQGPRQVHWLDTTLGQLEQALGLKRRIGIECQIEDARGVQNVDAIATASDRIETIIFGPVDLAASIQMPLPAVGMLLPEYPGDPFHYVLMRILIAARAVGAQAIDGPFTRIRDVEGFRASAKRTAALGFDGKWALHPAQIEVANDAYTPQQDAYDRAELILDAYERATSIDAKGAVMLGDEMIDEASRKVALVIRAKGRALGMRRAGGHQQPTLA